LAHEGELIVAARWARPVASVFRRLYAARFPIRQLRLIDVYGGNDDRSDAADNSSGFNCRFVEGTTVWSEHARGRAIDLNPLENPQIKDGAFTPPAGRRFVNRTRWSRGMIHPRDKVVRAFASIGWHWGGYWHSLKDYMHFSATGR
jgi:D-alanyl-D-alanine carboxypeptidase